MADHKNQHFVPRVLLRPFTKDGEDKSINLYNIRTDQLIPDAAVKKQCSRSYWYGEDGELERILSGLEGVFGNARRNVATGGNSVKDLSDITLFMGLQHWRTAKAAERLRHSHQQLNENTWVPEKKPIPEAKKLIIESMRFGIRAHSALSDLKVRIVENRSHKGFVISDDPSAMLNRFSFQRLNRSAFGTHSSGLICVMPISPRYSVLCYDAQVYSLDVSEGRSILTKSAHVAAYNEIQMLTAEENIYFHRWEDGAAVRSQFLAIKDKRQPASTVQTFVPDGEDQFAEHYRPGTVEEGRQAKRSLMSVKFNYPEPEHWIPGLGYRAKPKTFHNGTGIGYVRKQEWLRDGRSRRPSLRGNKVTVIRTRPSGEGGA